MAAEIRALTGVRGVAALVIVVYHFGKFHIDRSSGHMVWAVPHGYMPVDMFFMLSGFVMGYTYKDAFVSAPWENYKTFLIKRFARLYPAYWVIGALYALKMAAGLTGEETFARFDAWDAVGNFLMLVGWGLHIYPMIGVSWAACVVLSFAGIYLVSISGKGSSGPLDVVQVDSLLPLLRALAGFTLGLATFRF